MADETRTGRAVGIIGFDEIDSTNAEALRRAAQGEQGPLWITAARQTLGRGRSGRSWVSAPGALAATLLFRPTCDVACLPQLSLVAGVAAYDAIAEALPVADRSSLRLKWPNDVLLGAAKVSGILVESMMLGQAVTAAIGIGINVDVAPDVGGRSVVSLASHGATRNAAEVGISLYGQLGRWLDVWDGGANFGEIRTAWLARGSALGEPMSINAGDGPVTGRFAGLDADGALLLDVGDEAARRFTFGDVALGAAAV